MLQSAVVRALTKFGKKYACYKFLSLVFVGISILVLILILLVVIQHYFIYTTYIKRAIFFLFITSFIFLLIAVPIYYLSKYFWKSTKQKIFALAKLLGNFYPSIKHQMINYLQLNFDFKKSDLLDAALSFNEKKILETDFIRKFKYKELKTKYLYLFISLTLFFIFNTFSFFSSSLNKLLNYDKTYHVSDNYRFLLLNKKLKLLKGDDLDLKVKVIGKRFPENIFLMIDKVPFLMSKDNDSIFEYKLTGLKEDKSFYFKTHNDRSRDYNINIVRSPLIKNIELKIVPPKYLKLSDRNLSQASKVKVHKGSYINWKITTEHVDTIYYMGHSLNRIPIDKNVSSFSKRIFRDETYTFITCNRDFSLYKDLPYKIEIIEDEPPQIKIVNEPDTLLNRQVNYGFISDDNYLDKLSLIYYPNNDPEKRKQININIPKQSIFDFVYIFSKDLDLEDNKKYTYYFEVKDNYPFSHQTTRSRLFHYSTLNQSELDSINLIKKENIIDLIEKVSDKINFSNTLELSEIMESKHFYNNLNLDNLLEEQFDLNKKLKETLKQLEILNTQNKHSNNTLSEKLDELFKQTQEHEASLDALQTTPDKEQAFKKMKEEEKILKKQLSQFIQMSKRYNLESKLNRIREKFKSLTADLSLYIDLEYLPKTFLDTHQSLHDNFGQYKTLFEANRKLIKPLKIYYDKILNEAILMNLDKSKTHLSNNPLEFHKKLNIAVDLLKVLIKNMDDVKKNAQSKQLKEDLSSLKKTIFNNLNLSFKHETLYSELDGKRAINNQMKDFKELSTIFKRIDDSIQSLSFTIPKIKKEVFLSIEEYYLNTNLATASFKEAKINNVSLFERMALTSLMRLNDKLTAIIDNIELSRNKGSGESNEEISLPNIIDQQKQLGESYKKQLEKSKREGSPMTKEMIHLYKKQQFLKNLLSKLDNIQLSDKIEKLKLKMDGFSKGLIEKGFSESNSRLLKNIEQGLVNFDFSEAEKEESKERKSKSASTIYQNQYLNIYDSLSSKKQRLIKQQMPFENYYKRINSKYREYIN